MYRTAFAKRNIIFFCTKNLDKSAFIHLVIDYVVENGLIEENKILIENPFDQFNLGEVFSDSTLLNELLSSIKAVSDNAVIRL